MFSMLLQNKIGQSLSQGSPLRRNETGKMKTKKSTNYDQYFSLSKRMRFPVKLGNNIGSTWLRFSKGWVYQLFAFIWSPPIYIAQPKVRIGLL